LQISTTYFLFLIPVFHKVWCTDIPLPPTFQSIGGAGYWLFRNVFCKLGHFLDDETALEKIKFTPWRNLDKNFGYFRLGSENHGVRIQRSFITFEPQILLTFAANPFLGFRPRCSQDSSSSGIPSAAGRQREKNDRKVCLHAENASDAPFNGSLSNALW